jgi:hypothetical protein
MSQREDIPRRPWLIFTDGDLFGDYRSESDRNKALPEARATGAVSTSQWDPGKWGGPGWTDAEPEAS